MQGLQAQPVAAQQPRFTDARSHQAGLGCDGHLGHALVAQSQRVCFVHFDIAGKKTAVEQVRKLAQIVAGIDRKSTRLNSSHVASSYAVFCLKKKKIGMMTLTASKTIDTTFTNPHTCFNP